MKKTRITYGVRGMMTYIARIAVGKAHMKVTFSDGSISAIGSKPAVFTTDNYIVQKGIEQSEQFKSGLIFVYASYPLDEDLEVETNKADVSDDTGQPANEDKGNMSESLVSDDAGQDNAEQTADDANTAAPTALEEGAEEDNGPIRVEFEANEDAKDYLEQHYQVTRSKLRTRADIVAKGQELGVDIVFV